MKIVKRTLLTVANKTLDTVDRRLLPFIWMGVIFYFSSIPDLSLKGDLAVFDFVLRKFAHISIFALLFIFWKLNTKYYVIAAFLTLLYAIIDEYHQSVVPGRHRAFTDVCIDAIGILIGMWLYKTICAWKREHDAQNL